MSLHSLPLLMEAAQLDSVIKENVADKDICIIDLSSDHTYETGHVPGAIHLPFQTLMSGQAPVPGKLPSKERLEKLFSELGLQKHTHFVVYDDEGGGWAGRFIWTLDVIGHTGYSYLNGGIHAWLAGGFTAEKIANTRRASNVSLSIFQEPIAEISDILEDGKSNEVAKNVTIWDARSPSEYSGESVRAAKGGHIPGAINCEWTTLMDQENNLRIRSDAKEYLHSIGINNTQNIITHCQSHHRSGFTYLVGKILGFNIRAYHGSWAEWGNHPDTPVNTAL